MVARCCSLSVLIHILTLSCLCGSGDGADVVTNKTCDLWDDFLDMLIGFNFSQNSILNILAIRMKFKTLDKSYKTRELKISWAGFFSWHCVLRVEESFYRKMNLHFQKSTECLIIAVRQSGLLSRESREWEPGAREQRAPPAITPQVTDLLSRVS